MTSGLSGLGKGFQELQLINLQSVGLSNNICVSGNNKLDHLLGLWSPRIVAEVLSLILKTT